MGSSFGASAIGYAEGALRIAENSYKLAKKDFKSLDSAIEFIDKVYDDLLKLSDKNDAFGFFERRKYQKLVSKMQQLHENVHQLKNSQSC